MRKLVLPLSVLLLSSPIYSEGLSSKQEFDTKLEELENKYQQRIIERKEQRNRDLQRREEQKRLSKIKRITRASNRKLSDLIKLLNFENESILNNFSEEAEIIGPNIEGFSNDHPDMIASRIKVNLETNNLVCSGFYSTITGLTPLPNTGRFNHVVDIGTEMSITSELGDEVICHYKDESDHEVYSGWKIGERLRLKMKGYSFKKDFGSY